MCARFASSFSNFDTKKGPAAVKDRGDYRALCRAGSAPPATTFEREAQDGEGKCRDREFGGT